MGRGCESKARFRPSEGPPLPASAAAAPAPNLALTVQMSEAALFYRALALVALAFLALAYTAYRTTRIE